MKEKAEEEEVVPPALNLTAQQLFWVGFGQSWCLFGGNFERDDSFEDVLMSNEVSCQSNYFF